MSAKKGITIEKETVTLNFQYPYEIDLKSIKNEADLLKWVLHLSEKLWMDREKIRDFIKLVGYHKGFEIRGLR